MRRPLGVGCRLAAAWALAMAAGPPRAAAAHSAASGAQGGPEMALQVLGQEPLAPAWAQFIAQVWRRTSIAIAPTPRALSAPLAEALFASPLVVWPQEVGLAEAGLSASLLRRYLEAGGSLWLDGAAGHPGAQRVVEALGGQALRPLAAGHVLFKTFYLLDAAGAAAGPAPRVEAGRGVVLAGRLAVWGSGQPLAPAWAQGAWSAGDAGDAGGQGGGEVALRMAINWLMYTLCLDYKDDQVHLPFILRRRQ